MVRSRFEDPYAYLSGGSQNDEPRGLKCELKMFESRYNSKGERVKLEAGTRQDLELPEQGSESALVLTKHYERDGELGDTVLEVQSPHLKAALEKVITHYPGLQFNAEEIILSGLPKCLFHYRTELTTYGNSLQDAEAKKHLSLLLKHMWKVFETQIRTYSSLMESPLGLPIESPGLNFEHLWMAFRPGCFIYVQGLKDRSVMRLKQMEKHMRQEMHVGWDITGEQITYDGKDFGYITRALYVRRYEDYRSLKQLPVYPLQYAPQPAEIRREMIARGQKFVSLRGVHYKSYRGAAEALAPFRNTGMWGEEDSFPLRTTPVDGRIIIDSATFDLTYPSMTETFAWNSEKLSNCNDFSDDHFLICNRAMPGFSLAKKQWCYFNVDCIEDVELNSRAFDRLLLADGQKEMIRSLVQVHTSEMSDFDDVIKGKGKGMVFLLHGVPGVGKTLTAESVADHTRKPLYTITCGDLGADARTIEERLSNALHLATLWNAVVLLDEADVFLEQRSTHDLQRNGLVSIFLRVLEYYEGILFLTTNRIDVFDAAFSSRIHLAIKYYPLQFTTRRELWRSFITSTSQGIAPVWLDDAVLDELASAMLNGRQIKNAIRTAHALAMSAGESFNNTHIEKSLNAMKLFQKHISEDAEKTVDDSEEGHGRRKALAEGMEDEMDRSGEGRSRKRRRPNDEEGE